MIYKLIRDSQSMYGEMIYKLIRDSGQSMYREMIYKLIRNSQSICVFSQAVLFHAPHPLSTHQPPTNNPTLKNYYILNPSIHIDLY